MAATTTFATVEEAIEDIREGRMVVVVDDPDRENEGDLVIAAQFATPEAINFMATHARGLVCLCLTEERADHLGLRPMTDHNEAPLGTAFTVSIEAREGVPTGISAADRSRTIQVAIHPESTAHDLVQPGHVFPLRARRGGVLERVGQTEAAVDLARLAGLNPSGVVCEIMNDDGTMARVPDLVPYCERHGLKMITVADLVEYRRRHEKLVERGAAVRLPTEYGEFTVIAFREKLTGKAHLALVKGDVYGIGNQILADLGLTTIRILTNNPKKLTGIDGFGLTVVEQVPIEVTPQTENRRYLTTKRDKLGHRLHHQDLKNLDYEPEPE